MPRAKVNKASSVEQQVKAILPRLWAERITYFPVRHQSPACSFHLRRLILETKPAVILVEGPRSFNTKIDLLTDKDCVCPVAIFTNFIDKNGRVAENNSLLAGLELPGDQPLRFSAYYPFCDYSPELVALRSGSEIGAKLAFIDLEYGEMVLHNSKRGIAEDRETGAESLTKDSHIRYSDYIDGLTRELGMRNFDEVWDHLFESTWDRLTTREFVDQLATFCILTRLSHDPSTLELDGTNAREACMAAHIKKELETTSGNVLVVTGGFHSVALPDLVANSTKAHKEISFSRDETGTWLMRYSFDRLDSQSGYQSGVPSPAYYDRLWRIQSQVLSQAESPANIVTRSENLAADIFLEVAAKVRLKNFSQLVSTPDVIAAQTMAKHLAALRGHRWPVREDILDGVRSCFIKGEINIEGQHLLKLVQEVLAGDRVGKMPAQSDIPPLVADFRAQAKRYRLNVETLERKKHSLDLYRNRIHRLQSRFFHRLVMLTVPYCRFTDGPNFTIGTGLEMLQEHWQTEWTPVVESSLIEASVYGTNLEEAAGNKLREQIRRLEMDGEARSTRKVVGILMRACQMGLQSQAKSLVPLIDLHIAEDPDIYSVTSGLSQLELILTAREPLGAAHLKALPELIVAAYRRATSLLHNVSTAQEGEVEQIVQTLLMLREIVSASSVEGIDADLLYGGLAAIVDAPPEQSSSAIVGAACGILYGEGKLSPDKLIEIVCGYLTGTLSNPKDKAGIIRGLLETACEIAWQVGEIMESLDKQLQNWDDSFFLSLLPELRLAFAGLTPKDISRVAELVASFHGKKDLGNLVRTEIEESDLAFGLALNNRVRAILENDGLSR